MLRLRSQPQTGNAPHTWPASRGGHAVAGRKKRLETGGVGGTRRCGMCRWLICACACVRIASMIRSPACVCGLLSRLWPRRWSREINTVLYRVCPSTTASCMMLCTYIRNVAITDNVSSYLPTTLSCNAVAGARNLGQPRGRPSTGRLAVNTPLRP